MQIIHIDYKGLVPSWLDLSSKRQALKIQLNVKILLEFLQTSILMVWPLSPDLVQWRFPFSVRHGSVNIDRSQMPKTSVNMVSIKRHRSTPRSGSNWLRLPHPSKKSPYTHIFKEKSSVNPSILHPCCSWLKLKLPVLCHTDSSYSINHDYYYLTWLACSNHFSCVFHNSPLVFHHIACVTLQQWWIAKGTSKNYETHSIKPNVLHSVVIMKVYNKVNLL